MLLARIEAESKTIKSNKKTLDRIKGLSALDVPSTDLTDANWKKTKPKEINERLTSIFFMRHYAFSSMLAGWLRSAPAPDEIHDLNPAGPKLSTWPRHASAELGGIAGDFDILVDADDSGQFDIAARSAGACGASDAFLR